MELLTKPAKIPGSFWEQCTGHMSIRLGAHGKEKSNTGLLGLAYQSECTELECYIAFFFPASKVI